MLNVVWITMMVLAVIFGIINHRIADVVASINASANTALDIALHLIGTMALWLGIAKVAERAGMMRMLAHVMQPLLRRLFPELSKDSPALALVVMNLAANVLGLANAATPIGLKAMEALQAENEHKTIASDAMCMFLAINTSSVQLIPVTAIAFLAANGATEPTVVVTSALLATSCSTIAALLAVSLFSRMRRFKTARYLLSNKEDTA